MSKTIMTVDDSASVRQMVKFTLQNEGYDVHEAVDGQDAFNKIKQLDKLDLLVTDLNMPNMDGIELIREVRKLDTFRFLPILMLTSESQEGKKQEGKQAGASGWIVKPFKPEQLVAVIRRVLV
ncbi:MAG: two-component system response regulator [Desulfuromonas sp.]|nr:MAG: two-component system response regulator [Desulfuromonas sp.]